MITYTFILSILSQVREALVGGSHPFFFFLGPACGLDLDNNNGKTKNGQVASLQTVSYINNLTPDLLVGALSPFEIFQRDEISAIHFPLKDQGSS